MTMYAAAGYAAAKARYNTIDLASRVEGATPHQLISVLYDEVRKALDTLAVGLSANGTLSRAGAIERKSRVNAILLSLEGCLDHTQGGELAQGLAAIYREARRLADAGAIGHDPKPIIQAREMIAEIAEAWARIG
jgi:flagellar secretion chaperone FliS